jgi:hypothetical protein
MLTGGSVALGTGVLLVGTLAVLLGHPRAPRWARSEIVAYLSAVAVVCVIAFGAGHVAYGGFRAMTGDGDPRELLVPPAVAAIVVAIWYAAGFTRRLRAYAAASEAQRATAAPVTEIRLAGSEEAWPQAHAPGPRRQTRKAA